MSPRALPTPAVQLVTGAWSDERDLAVRVEAALAGGIRWIQLRAKDRPAREIYRAASAAAPLVRACRGTFVVNDRVDVAIAVGADGVHLPERGLAASAARRLLGDGAWIARSVHSVDAVNALQDEAIDALQFGPVFDTPSKRAFGEPQGIERLAVAARAATRTPILAVGGLDAGRAAMCRRAGAAAASVIGAIWDAPDVEAAARRFVEALSR